MLNEILIIIGLTLLPFLELRAAIPYGVLVLKMNWFTVFLIAVLTNMLLGPVLFIFVDKFIHLFLRIKFFDKWYSKYVEKSQKKIKPYVEKYGILGIALFIGIPRPGSGSYSGTLGSYLLGISLKKFTLANALGVLIAGILVMVAVASGNGIFEVLFKVV